MANAFMPVFTVVSFLPLPSVRSAENTDPLVRLQAREAIVQLQQADYERIDGYSRSPADIHVTLAGLAARQQAFSRAGVVKFDSSVSGATTASRLASYSSIYHEN
ncbi:hypothetical protein M3I53_32220 [Paraburkholderia sp. CNPSo 3272]|uniref:hypothetical protein n=1 Tax=Paraburkholderia sp. CNPSo 3272 TaxID=2940931 RepID=UPI0020B6FCEB|nr:hypothetical protein [Paraburkholderia sp. CNPSo 3272]MCP3727736.1 hypothetical protein [Paraburkholderia sp. CNPSo 3272]